MVNSVRVHNKWATFLYILPLASTCGLRRACYIVHIMMQLTFTDAEKQALHEERFHHPHPRVQQRMETLWLKSQGLAHAQICRLVVITENTLRSYLRIYQEGGIEALREIRFAKPTSKLDAYRGSMETLFRQNPPRSVNEAAAVIEKQTGIRRSPEQVRRFGASPGFALPQGGHGAG
jgi:transposase